MDRISDFRPHLDWIDSQQQHMVFLTESWSKINSGSYHLDGLARMLKALEDNFMWLGGQIRRIDLPPLEVVSCSGITEQIPVGRALAISVRPEAKTRIFLGGHMDTVFAKDHPFQVPRYLDDNTLNGPGVADLKGGLVVMLKALEALEHSPYANHIGYEIIINPDEEIGSQSSDFLFEPVAKQCALGLIYEPALADGTLAGARKGSGNFTCVVRGVSAHAGRDFDKGKNAIVSAAKLSLALDSLNGQREGVTINIGKAEGGGALNMVPDLAIVRFNVRVPDDEARLWVEKEIHRLCDQHPDEVLLHGRFTRPPKPMADAGARLFDAVKETGAMLDLPVSWNATGGCCDGNNLWAYGLPNVDTLGVRGGKIHTDAEFVLLDSLAERAKLSALLLMRIATGELAL